MSKKNLSEQKIFLRKIPVFVFKTDSVTDYRIRSKSSGSGSETVVIINIISLKVETVEDKAAKSKPDKVMSSPSANKPNGNSVAVSPKTK
jgi:hypothetical protein